MIQRGFWKGILAGGLIAAVFGMMVKPQMKPTSSQRIIGRSKKMRNQAQRVIREVKKGVDDLMD